MILRKIKPGFKANTIIGLGTLLLFALLVMGGTIYYHAMTLAVNELLESIGKNIEKDALEIEIFVKSSKDDLMVISDTPPVQGIIRAKDNGGTDPLTGDKTEYWYRRMEQIFGAFLKYHPEYSQIRYIDEKGDEMVRADLTGNTVKITPRKELQNKAQYPYFRETMKLKPDEVYYSDVNMNREHGALQIPHTPVFRIATPVYDTQKRVRGVIVINTLIDVMFSKIRPALGRVKKYVVNRDGYFFVHPDRSKEFGFDLGFEYTANNEMPELADEMKAKDSNVKYHKQMKHLDAFKKIFFDPMNRDRYWVLICEIPEQLALRNIYLHRNTMLIVGLLIIVFSLVLITWFSTRKLVTPILKLSEAVKKIEKGDFTARVREDGIMKDEIRELAVSFNNMAFAIEAGITEIEQKGESLRREKLQNELILNSIGEGIYGLDNEGRTTFLNPAGEAMLGRNAEELLGIPMHDITHHTRADGRVYPQKECMVYAAFRDNRIYYVNDEVFWRKDGTSFPVEYTSTPVINDSGEAVGAVVVFRDITERKRMEKAVKESNERYLTLYEGIDDALFVHGITEDGSAPRFLEVNNIACQRLGYSREELLAMSPADIDAPESDTDITPVVEQVMAGNSVTFYQTHVAKDGRRIPVEIRSRMLMLQGQRAVISLARDITERKRAEELLKKYNEELEAQVKERTQGLEQARLQAEAANRAKSEFLSNMSHELRTPLNSVIGFTQLLQDDVLGPLSAQQLDAVNDINTSGRHLLSLINDILDIAKVESGKMELEPGRVEIKGLLHASLSMIKEKAMKHGIKLDIQVGPEADIEIEADERKLKQIMFNLLSNAVKFTNEGGSVRVSARRVVKGLKGERVNEIFKI